MATDTSCELQDVREIKDFQEILKKYYNLQYFGDFDYHKSKKTEGFLLPEWLQSSKIQYSRLPRSKNPSVFLPF